MDSGEDSTGFAFIDQAVAAGVLDGETALVYVLYAVFHDPRLPTQYRGADADAPTESDILEQVRARFSTLSAPTQAIVRPYLQRPTDRGDSAGRDDSAGGARSLSRDSGACRGVPAGWVFKSDPAGHVKVWYPSGSVVDGATAAFAQQELDTVIWPSLIGTLGLKAPLDDSKVLGCDGGDGRLDVYIVEMATMGATDTDQGETTPTELGSRHLPAYIFISNNLSGDVLRGALAHELMHAIQLAYDAKGSHPAYGWLNDATANWAAEDYVYPGKYIERRFSNCWTKSPQKSVDDRSTGSCSGSKRWRRDYGGYLFFQYAAHAFGAATIKTVLDGTESFATSLEAINAALPGGWREDFLGFSKTFYNDDPVVTKPASFAVWDQMEDKTDRNLDTAADLSGVSELKTVLANEMKNLSTKYYRFTFSDPNTRSVLFNNGYFAEQKNGKAIRVFAFWKDTAGAWQEEEWTKYQYVGLCRDLTNQRAQELVIVMSNGEWLPEGGGSLTASGETYLTRNNTGCFRYKGTTTLVQTHAGWSGTPRTATGNVSFELDPSAFGLDAVNPAIADSLRLGLSLSRVLSGTSYSFQEGYSDGSCQYTAGPTSFTLTAAQPIGFLMVNQFSELKHAEPLVQAFIASPRGSYTATAGSTQTVSEVVTGVGCNGTAPTVVGGLILTNAANNGVNINPPLAADNGDLTGSFVITSGATSSWQLHAEMQ